MVLVEAPGLPYARSIYSGPSGFVNFYTEVTELIVWAKPTMQIFALTPEWCITKVKVMDPAT